MSDDPFESCDEDSSNDDIQHLFRKRPTPIVIKPANRQFIIDWVASTWKKIEQHPDMVTKSFVITGIAQDLEGSEDDILRYAEVQEEISTILDSPQDMDSNLSTSDLSSYDEANEYDVLLCVY